MIIESSDITFKEDIGTDGITVALLWADYSPPCKMLFPHFEAAVKKMGVKAARVNVADNPKIPSQFIVRGLPALIAFRDGKVYDVKIGAMPSDTLDEWLFEVLKK